MTELCANEAHFNGAYNTIEPEDMDDVYEADVLLVVPIDVFEHGHAWIDFATGGDVSADVEWWTEMTYFGYYLKMTLLSPWCKFKMVDVHNDRTHKEDYTWAIEE